MSENTTDSESAKHSPVSSESSESSDNDKHKNSSSAMSEDSSDSSSSSSQSSKEVQPTTKEMSEDSSSSEDPDSDETTKNLKELEKDEEKDEKKEMSEGSSSYEPLHGQLETSNSSEEEEEDNLGQFEPKEWQHDFLELLPKLSKGEKVDHPVFEGELLIPKKSQTKQTKLGDYVRDRILEVEKTNSKANVFDDEDTHLVKETPVKEESRLLSEFQKKANELETDSDDLLEVKEKAPTFNETVQDEVKEEKSRLDPDTLSFWTQKSADKNEEFLKKFILEKKWMELEENDSEENKLEKIDLDEDQKEIERADDEEAKERLGIVSYGRKIKETLRKESQARRKTRERLKERKEEQRRKAAAKENEKKKAQKKKIEEKIKELQKSQKIRIDENFLDEDFDEEKFDKMMENYDENYDENDADIEKMREEIADEMREEDYDGQNEPEDTNGQIPKKVKFKKNQNDNIFLEQSDGSKKKVDVEKMRGKDKSLDKMIDDYYKLENSEKNGNDNMRFEYVNVNKDDSGLTAMDILTLSDKELNQIIGFRKLATYSDWRPNNTERQKVRELHSKQKKQKVEKIEKENVEEKSESKSPQMKVEQKDKNEKKKETQKEEKKENLNVSSKDEWKEKHKKGPRQEKKQLKAKK
ncbi:protein kri1, putative [Entamoeba invadens IP1]|uniref:Protein kri1, putative n=1 Tax=Entamoeba invadens IP1 TaxID=370355 RepID=A0A0A1TY87_ENTIV|nr:protein kri1, putative [Entamoeba invadens IP1]ELP86439.1 protein kri1, putative [Entamoeba invadens IP1]|eukprot:XP_004185785.1 protein kri1, putative [Entamoeba invadens IP1]